MISTVNYRQRNSPKKKDRKASAAFPSGNDESTLCFFFCVALSEPFNSSGGINELLFSGIERMAFIAKLDVPAWDRGPRFNDIAA
jgi:hypothetical protein